MSNIAGKDAALSEISRNILLIIVLLRCNIPTVEAILDLKGAQDFLYPAKGGVMNYRRDFFFSENNFTCHFNYLSILSVQFQVVLPQLKIKNCTMRLII